jgi:molybdopterin-guanine dinucleotide biosynthesis protein A
MGRNKALLELNGEPLIVRMVGRVRSAGVPATVIGPADLFQPFGLEGIADDEPGLGPLGGIATALAHSSRDWNLIVAVDLPNVTAAWLRALVERALRSTADALLPRSEGGLEPLCAVYHRRCLEPIRRALRRGVRKVTDGLAGPPACQVEEIGAGEWNRFAPDGKLFENINTLGEYARALQGGKR